MSWPLVSAFPSEALICSTRPPYREATWTSSVSIVPETRGELALRWQDESKNAKTKITAWTPN